MNWNQKAVFPALLVLSLACHKTEMPAPAEVTETSSTSSTSTMTTTTMASGPATTANVIADKSSIAFTGAKVTGSHDGVFQKFNGQLMYTGATPTGINFDIDLGSVKTDAAKLDGHLKTPDFFDVAKFPKATFTSTSITPGATPSDYTVAGTLDMHGVKKDVTFPVKVETSPAGVHSTASFSINRKDWGIAYTGAADNLIKDEVAIKLDLWFPPAPQA